MKNTPERCDNKPAAAVEPSEPDQTMATVQRETVKEPGATIAVRSYAARLCIPENGTIKEDKRRGRVACGW